MVKNPPVNAGDTGDVGLTPASKDPLERKLATHSSILAWEIAWTENPGGLQSMGSHTVGHDLSDRVHTYIEGILNLNT